MGHVGYLLIGFSTGTIEGVYAMMVYTVIYIIMTLNAWTFILSTELETKGRSTYFTDLGYLSRINPTVGNNLYNVIIIYGRSTTISRISVLKCMFSLQLWKAQCIF